MQKHTQTGNKRVKHNVLAARIGTVTSLVLLATIFTLLAICNSKMEKNARPLLNEAKQAAHQSNFDSAIRSLMKLNSIIADCETQLTFYFHHKEIVNLRDATRAALEMAILHETDTLITMLLNVESYLDYITETNRLSVGNIL